MALVGISSVHLLKTFTKVGSVEIPADMSTALAEQFIAAGQVEVKWQGIIHLTFIVSAIAMAYTDRVITKTLLDAHDKEEVDH